MKKFVAMLLALVMVFALCACGDKPQNDKQDKAAVKVGFICLHDENSTYDKNFIDAAKAACKNAGLSEDQYIIKTNIPEGQECYNAAAVCPSVTMDVTFTGSWYDEALEKEAANKLIAGGCKLISQHADSMGAPTACEQAGVPNVSYNGSTQSACPNTFIVSSRIDWTPYYEMVIKAVQDGTALDSDWTGTLKTGSVVLTDVNEKVAAKGTAEKIAEVTKQLEDGTLHVFDTSAFTVKGETLTSYMADVDTDADNTGDTEAIKDGYFHESEFRAAPYFNVQIDGINLLDQNFGS